MSEALVIQDKNNDEVNAADLSRLASGIRRDPGSIARDRMNARAAQLKKVMVRTYLLITLVLFGAVGGLGYYGYNEYTTSGVRYVDYRPCKYEDEKTGITITGRRSYSYMQHSILGFQFRDTSKVDEQTQIDVNGSAITVVGLSKDSWYSLYVDTGEQGIQILKPAMSYVFTTQKKAAYVGYDSFCR
jgi:hypothetical protein